MNERIYKLAVEVGIIKEEGEYFWIQSVDELERFAELLLQECIELSEEFDSPKLSGPGMIIANRIKDRFGLGFCPCCGVPSGHLHDDSCIWS